MNLANTGLSTFSSNSSGVSFTSTSSKSDDVDTQKSSKNFQMNKNHKSKQNEIQMSKSQSENVWILRENFRSIERPLSAFCPNQNTLMSGCLKNMKQPHNSNVKCILNRKNNKEKSMNQKINKCVQNVNTTASTHQGIYFKYP